MDLLRHLMVYLRARTGDERGVTIIEYMLMLVLIALAVAGSVPSITDAVVNVITAVQTALAPPVA